VQLLVDELVGLRVHMFDGVNEPEPLVAKVIMPVGLVGVEDVSVTVAVHVVCWFTATLGGLQLTVVVVGWGADIAVASPNTANPAT